MHARMWHAHFTHISHTHTNPAVLVNIFLPLSPSYLFGRWIPNDGCIQLYDWNCWALNGDSWNLSIVSICSCWPKPSVVPGCELWLGQLDVIWTSGEKHTLSTFIPNNATHQHIKMNTMTHKVVFQFRFCVLWTILVIGVCVTFGLMYLVKIGCK